MKTIKKLTAAILCVLMLLTAGVTAFAADSYNWTPIPTSPAGLQNGDYYLDFTDFLTNQAQAPGQDLSAEEIAAQIAVYNGGTWFIDYDAVKLKGSITVPAGMPSPTDEERTIEFTPDMATVYLMQYDVLREVGVTWIPVAKSTDGLNDGDYYIDLTSTDDTELVDMLSRDEVKIYVNANAGSRLMKYKLVADKSTYYLPLADSMVGFVFERCPVVRYQAPAAQGQNGGSGVTSVWSRILTFFNRIIDFFRSLFR